LANSIYDQIRRIGDGAAAPDTYPNDNYGQTLRIADKVGAVGTYSGDMLSQLRRIADGISAPDTYPRDIYNQVRRIADKVGGASTYTNDIYGQLTRIADTGLNPLAFFGSATVPENTAVSSTLGTVAVTGGTGPYTFAITAGNGAGKFALDSSTGVMTLAGALDYETTTSYALTITADNGVDAVLTLTLTLNVGDVDEIAPTISSLSFTSTPVANSTYLAGEIISVTIVWSESVVVTGTPQLTLNVGGKQDGQLRERHWNGHSGFLLHGPKWRQ
jgi:hypothetical protein